MRGVAGNQVRCLGEDGIYIHIVVEGMRVMWLRYSMTCDSTY